MPRVAILVFLISLPVFVFSARTDAFDSTQIIVSGIINGTLKENPRVYPDQDLQIGLLGLNLTRDDLDKLWITDADRCEKHDITKRLKKDWLSLVIDEVFVDNLAMIVTVGGKLKSGIEQDARSYHVCTDHMNWSQLPPEALQIDVVEPVPLLVPLPMLIACTIPMIILSGIFSGLNLAFTCIPLDHLAVAEKSPDKVARMQAKKLLPLIRRRNWVIATCAIANAVVNVSLTLILDQIMQAVASGNMRVLLENTVPVMLIMLFGEVLPQALCYKRTMSIASFFAYFVYFFMALLGVVSYPLAALCDAFLGKEPVRVYDMRKLEVMLATHIKDKELLRNLRKMLTFRDVTIDKIMTRIQDAYLISKNDRVDLNRMVHIIEKGYTRVPVYEGINRCNVVTVLNVKDLLLVNAADGKKVSEITNAFVDSLQLRFASHDMLAPRIMKEMVQGKQHLMMVFRFCNKAYNIVGLVTLEDIIEQFIGEIEDDNDVAFPALRSGTRRNQSTFDWFKQEKESGTNLTTNQILKLSEQVMDTCPIFRLLNFNVHAMRALMDFSLHPPGKFLEKGATIRNLIVIVEGTVRQATPDPNRSLTIYGIELLPLLYGRCLANNDGWVDTSDLTVTSRHDVDFDSTVKIMTITMENIRNLLMVLRFDRLNDDVSMTQYDTYAHFMSAMAEIANISRHKRIPRNDLSGSLSEGTPSTKKE